MYLNDGGYSRRQFHNKRLRETARIIADKLPRIMRETEADAVVVTGKSGMSMAFAASMLIDFPLVVVRKRGERNHGNAIEGTMGVDVKRYVMLDDFIESGDTLKEMDVRMHEYWETGTDHTGVAPVCVGVVLYASTSYSGEPEEFHGLMHSGPVPMYKLDA